MEIIFGILIVVELINISLKLIDSNIYQKEMLSQLKSIERELSYSRITNRRLTDMVIKQQELLEEVAKMREDVFNLRYYIGAVYHQELKEFTKKKEKGL